MAKEDYLIKKCGKNQHFEVPEGYFESFSDKVMESLPERNFEEIYSQKTVTMWDKVKPLVYLAAMFAGIALMFAVAEDFVSDNGQSEQKNLVTSHSNGVPVGENSNAEYSEEVAEYCDYVMNNSDMDDYSMYQYLEEVVE